MIAAFLAHTTTFVTAPQITALFPIPVLLLRFSTAEDFWLRPLITELCLPLFCIVAIVACTESVRSMGWIERKDFLAFAYGLIIISNLILLLYALNSVGVLEEVRASERASQELKDKAADAAREAEELLKAEKACNEKLSAETGRAFRRRSEARALFRRCKVDFESSKTIFTSDNVEKRCKNQGDAADAADSAWKAALSKNCLALVK